MGIQVFANVDSNDLATARSSSVFDHRNINFKQVVAGDAVEFDLFLVNNDSRESWARANDGPTTYYYTEGTLLNIQDYSVRLGIGQLNGKPSEGTFDIGAQTVAFDADDAAVQTAITTETAACTVTKLANGVYRVAFDAVGAQTIPTGNASNLGPESSVLINRLVDGDGSTNEEWLIRLFTNPAALNLTWENIEITHSGGKELAEPLKGLRGTLNLGTTGIYDLMGNASSAVSTIEVELTDGNGSIQTVLQMPIKITGEVIGQGATGTAQFSSFLTTADVGASLQQRSAILDATTASYTTAEETKLAAIEDAATADQTGAEIKAAYELEADTNAFTDAEQTKLAAIEDSATADQTGAEIKTAYELEADTNAFTDADQTKLAGIEDAATADQTGAEIKAAYELEADTNAFTDADQAKLDAIEDAADVTDETNVITALDNATLDDITTPASIDRVLIQDASDANSLKYVSFSEFGGAGSGDMLASTYDPGTVAGDAFDMDNMVAGTTNKLFTATDETKLDGIETAAEVNTINSDVIGEPTGSDQMLNVVSLTQAEYTAGTKVATTLYIITD